MVIHYFDLEDMIDGLSPENRGGALLAGSPPVVHLETVRESSPGPYAGVANHVVEVHARASCGGEIRVWKCKLGAYQTMHGRAMGGKLGPEDVANLADLAELKITARLEEAGIPVAPGLIDIHPAETVRGSWAGLDEIFAVYEGGSDDST